MQDKLTDDKMDRRGLPKCMTRIAGLIWTMSGGVPHSRLFVAGQPPLAIIDAPLEGVAA